MVVHADCRVGPEHKVQPTTVHNHMSTSINTFGTIETLRETTRQGALQDFGFFANHVLSLGLSQEDVENGQVAGLECASAALPSKRPNALGSALALWLRVRGNVVVTASDAFDLADHETLQWLFHQELVDQFAVNVVTVDVQPCGVILQWSKVA